MPGGSASSPNACDRRGRRFRLESRPATISGSGSSKTSILPDGQVVVLDSRLNVIRTYEPTGALVGQGSRPGSGPGELQAPEALAMDSRGNVVVADRFNALKIFRLAGGTFTHERDIRVDFVPEDFCVIGPDIIVQSWRSNGTVLHRYSADGAQIASFGRPYISESPLIQGQLSDGPLACSAGDSTIVMMFRYLPIVAAYGLDGTLRWRALLSDFRPMRIESFADDGRPAISQSAREEHEIAEGLVEVAPGVIAVQVGTHDLASRRVHRDYKALHTYLLDASTGHGFYAGTGVPRIMAVDDRHLWGASTEPYPRVIGFELAPASMAGSP